MKFLLKLKSSVVAVNNILQPNQLGMGFDSILPNLNPCLNLPTVFHVFQISS